MLNTQRNNMTLEQILVATVVWAILTGIVYSRTGWQKVKECYGMWFTKEYWTDYNKVEFVSWAAKAIIIVPGLIFGVSLWWLFFLTLVTSLALIWASNRKFLPTLVGFNTIWVWISCMVLAQHLIK
jgi:uncharacterized membrane protein